MVEFSDERLLGQYLKSSDLIPVICLYFVSGEQRESWCSVERMKEETFCRAQRRHYSAHLQTSVQSGQKASIAPASRCEWKPDNPKLTERKHYRHTCKTDSHVFAFIFIGRLKH